MATYHDLAERYSRDGEAAKKLIAVGGIKSESALSPSEVAAYTMVANLILNLDEVLTKG